MGVTMSGLPPFLCYSRAAAPPVVPVDQGPREMCPTELQEELMDLFLDPPDNYVFRSLAPLLVCPALHHSCPLALQRSFTAAQET